jgi:hypothetical protein
MESSECTSLRLPCRQRTLAKTNLFTLRAMLAALGKYVFDILNARSHVAVHIKRAATVKL